MSGSAGKLGRGVTGPVPECFRLAGLQGFDVLHTQGQQALRAGTYRVECPPGDGGPRWAVGAVLRPDPGSASRIGQVARAAAAVVGANHWLAGAARSSHLTLRRHLEPCRRHVTPADPLVGRYVAALWAAAQATGPVRFTVTGLVLTPASVMAAAVPADTAADDLAAAFDKALRDRGCHDAGAVPGLWYVNLAYFTGPVRDKEELIGWVQARRMLHVADVQITRMQIVKWQYTATGMVPIGLASYHLRSNRSGTPSGSTSVSVLGIEIKRA